MIKYIQAIIREFISLKYKFISNYPDTYVGLRLRKKYWNKKLRNSGYNLQVRSGAGIGHPNLVDIGNNFILGNNSLITANSSKGIFIGNDVGVARNVLMHSANHNFNDINIPIMEQSINAPKIEYNNKIYSIIIEDNVWIGSQSVILPGSFIRKGTVISSGSIVSGEFPENSILMGNPARVIKSRI